MNGLPNVDMNINHKTNSPSIPFKSNTFKEEEEKDLIMFPPIKSLDNSQREELNEKSNKDNKGKVSKSNIGSCKTCGCSIKSKILSCSLCQVLKCKACIEKESNVKPNQRKGVKKYFYICKLCKTKGKTRKHDINVHYEKEPTEFLQKKHKSNMEFDELDNNDNSDEESIDNESVTVVKKSKVSMRKKKKSKISNEKIYHLIEKNALHYFQDNNNTTTNKEEKCIECNCICLPNSKIKPFASIEQLLYYLHYYYENDQLFNNEKCNSNRIDYISIISNIIMKEKVQDSFSSECHFILCQNCLESLGKNSSTEFISSIDELLQRVHLLNQKKTLEESIFSSPSIYSKLSIIITQFLIVQGFSFYQKQFIQSLFSKITAINDKLSQNEYANSNILKLLLSSNSNVIDEQQQIQLIKNNHLRSEESINELNDIFSKFENDSKEILAGLSLENNDSNQMMKIMNNCLSIEGQSNEGVSAVDTNQLTISKAVIESLIQNFKNNVFNNLGECEKSMPFDNSNINKSQSIKVKSKDDNTSQESNDASIKYNELYPLILNMTQKPNPSSSPIDLLFKSPQLDYNNNNNQSNYNPNYFDYSSLINPNKELNDKPQIQNQIENVNVLFNNNPNFTLSLNNYPNNSNTLPHQLLPTLTPPPLHQYYPYQQQLQQFQNQYWQQINQMNPNLLNYPFYYPNYSYQMNHL